ncbi:MAG: hypothetical protein Q7K43_06610 [Candidatus Woesearchaeota archaeon]|nr:hypothetical protein [Candidatus Woesearchaeota archaeon]
MGLIKVMVDDVTEAVFRKAAMAHFGYEKGSLSKAADIALRQWSTFGQNETIMEDPVKAIKGMLRHVKKSSVELQHEARALWTK